MILSTVIHWFVLNNREFAAAVERFVKCPYQIVQLKLMVLEMLFFLYMREDLADSRHSISDFLLGRCWWMGCNDRMKIFNLISINGWIWEQNLNFELLLNFLKFKFWTFVTFWTFVKFLNLIFELLAHF